MARDESISIPPIKLRRVIVTIQGTTPLLTDRFAEEVQKGIEDDQTGKAKRAKAPRNPEKEWRSKLYMIDEAEERYGFPGAGIKKAMVSAGGRFADEQMTRLRGLFNVEKDLLEIRGPKPKMHAVMARLMGKTPIPAYRAVFEEWEMDVPIIYNADLITEEQLVNLVQLAGFAVGIGAWRAENKGTFGQFKPTTSTEVR